MSIENLSPKPDKDGFPPGININFIGILILATNIIGSSGSTGVNVA